MTEGNLKWLTYVLFLTYLGLIIGLEFIYRESLFLESLSLIKIMQKDMSDTVYSLLKCLSFLGSGSFFIFLFLIVHIFFSINNSFAFLIVFMLSYYLDNFMKIIYQNPRPFWVDPELKLSCNGGFGNPSGHSMSSGAVYLAFAHIITQNKYSPSYSRKIGKLIIFILFMKLIIAIMLSRVYLGAHSINQIIFGFLMGIAIYLFVFFVLQLNRHDGNTFFKFFSNIKMNFAFISSYVVLLGIGIFTWNMQRDNENLYATKLSELCPKLVTYKKFYNDGLHGILAINGVIGAHLGLMLLANLIDKNYLSKMNYVNEWYRGSFMHYFLRILLMLLFIIPFVFTEIIPEDRSLPVIFVFKVSIPYLLTFFSLYGPFIYSCLHLEICNRFIYGYKDFSSEIDSASNNNEIVKII